MPPRKPTGPDIRQRVDKQRREEKKFKHQQFENELRRCPICGHPTLSLKRSKQLMFIYCTKCSASDSRPLRQGWENADYHSEFLHRVLSRLQFEEQSALESISPNDIPNKIFYCLVKFSRKKIEELRRYAKKFSSKNIKIYTRKYVYHKGTVKQRTVRRAIGYALVKGNLATINTIVNYMRNNDVWLKIIKTSLSDKVIKNYSFSKGDFENR